MAVVYSSTPLVFQSSTHTDQVGIGAAPTNQTLLVSTSAHDLTGARVYTHMQQTDRDYAGGDTVRNQKRGIESWIDLDNNDAAWNPVAIPAIGIQSIVIAGANGPSYGTPLAYVGEIIVTNVPTPHNNEYSVFYGTIVAGSSANSITGGNYWFFDHALHGPIGRPGVLSGYSLVTNNHYNGSPSVGAAVAVCIQTADAIGGQNNNFTGVTTYPWDIGYFISGYATGGTGDGYTNAIQVGGLPGPWMGTGNRNYGGDVGQVARGVVVKAKIAGTSVARLGAFVSEGTGEGGGLVFGLDTSDVNRASIFRPVAGVLQLSGNLCLSSEAAATTATPANVSGKVPIYNAAGTLIGYIPVYGTL